MDRALKERVIGAIVLVIFAVLVVPVFLDGSSDDKKVASRSVTLPGQTDENTRQQTIVLKRDRTQPVPAASQAVPAEESTLKVSKSTATAQGKSVEPPQKSQVDDSKTTPPVRVANSPAAATQTASATGMWAVQMGSFSDKTNAERLAAELRSDGFAAFLSQLATSSGELHRVRIGPQKDRESAESIAAQLQKAGHKGQVVAHP